MWSLVTTAADRQEYLDVLLTDDAYSSSTIEGVETLQNRPGTEVWIYRELNSDFKIAFAFRKLEDRANAVPTGRITNCVACKCHSDGDACMFQIALTKLREVADRLGVCDYQVTAVDYSSEAMQHMVDCTRKYAWESLLPVSLDGGKTVYRFHRDPARTSEDSAFIGPEHPGVI